ncbi:hypothetical protein CVG87_29350 [Pseudomonas sp. WCS365]|nr:hypothetical protein CVG87_29350 [Pseudomonas sp. WCS365]
MKEAPFGVLFFRPHFMPHPKSHTGCAGLFASKLAPTGDLRQASISRLPKSSLWEQSLLAIVVGQVARMLDVSASSRASSLPQGICGRLRFPGYPSLLCGSKACSR